GARAAAEDSAADEAALQALAALDTSAKPVESARGTAPRVSLPAKAVTKEAERLFTPPTGGSAATTAPTFVLDVESFASNARVQYYLDFFLGAARDRFTIWIGRLNRYEGMIRGRFETYGVPDDLVYQAMIESGYSNTAVSHAKAVGMWQFMSFTGRKFGLVVDDWVDERRDPFKATDAAARYLAELNKQFGSWYLAAAAYDAGEGRIRRSLNKLPADPDSATDETFFTLAADRRYLKNETRDYVPKLIAAALIAKDPSRYGFDAIPMLPPLVFDEMTVPDMTGLDVIARLADTSTAAVQELNPQFFRGVTPPKREVIVRVPRGSGPRVSARYAELPSRERVAVVDHVVARGETLGLIAKHFGLSVGLIESANLGLSPTRLRVGQHLIIPVSLGAQRALQPVARAPQPAPKRMVTAARQSAAPAASLRRGETHTVLAGESLSLIGRHYGVSVSDLRRWNGIKAGEALRIGQRLVISPPATGDASPDLR
ncbi:MAG TPA: transglycosylase SLT domain-containing protein, partial [Gemmatimonadales bacterium]